MVRGPRHRCGRPRKEPKSPPRVREAEDGPPARTLPEAEASPTRAGGPARVPCPLPYLPEGETEPQRVKTVRRSRDQHFGPSRPPGPAARSWDAVLEWGPPRPPTGATRKLGGVEQRSRSHGGGGRAWGRAPTARRAPRCDFWTRSVGRRPPTAPLTWAPSASAGTRTRKWGDSHPRRGRAPGPPAGTPGARLSLGSVPGRTARGCPREEQETRFPEGL